MTSKLETWIIDCDTKSNRPVYETLLLCIAKSSKIASEDSAIRLLHGIKQFARESADHRGDFLSADTLSYSLDANILELLSATAHQLIRKDIVSPLIESLEILTNATQLSPVRFLLCWAYFNTNRFDDCIDECEKETVPTSSFYALQGQAYLDSGRTKEAVESLSIACKLDRSDHLSKFQLCKALMVEGLYSDAAQAILECKGLTGQHIELTALGAMTLIQSQGAQQSLNERFLQEVTRDLFQHFEEDPGNIQLLELGVQVALALNDQSYAKTFIHQFEHASVQSQRELTLSLARLVKDLSRKNWHGVISVLTGKGVLALQRSESLN